MASNFVNKIICNGGLFLSSETKRFLLVQRTQTKTVGTWGLVGGKKEPTDLTTLDSLTREIQEEVGPPPTIKKIIPLELFTSNDHNFQYNTYILLVEKEFIPNLNGEHMGYCWSKYDYWPKPLHQALKNSLHNKTIKTKIEILLDLL
jgi:ADP-ribose pyrophosphatase YjhB (NUDIX family)